MAHNSSSLVFTHTHTLSLSLSPSDWIRTINPADSSSTDNSNSHSIAVSSQPTNKPINTQTTPTSKNTAPTNKQATSTSKQKASPEKSSNKKEKLEGSARSTGKSRERKSRGKRRKHSRGTSVEGVTDVGVGAVSGEECEGEFGPKTSSPERGDGCTYSVFTYECMYYVYSGTSLFQTPLGLQKVSSIKRCPYFRSWFIHIYSNWDPSQCPLYRRCPYFRGVHSEGFHCT